MIGIYTGTGEDTAGEVISLIRGIITEICHDSLTHREVQAAKELIKGNFLLSMESTDNRMTRLARNELCFGRFISEGEVIERIEAVDRESVRDLADKAFRPATMSIAAMGRITEKDVVSVWGCA
jgi:predicted Zn-dependent peptidase